MNILKLRGKMAETGHSVDALASKIGVDRSTLYRKLSKGENITLGEASRIRNALNLTDDEATAIFLL